MKIQFVRKLKSVEAALLKFKWLISNVSRMQSDQD